MLLSLLLTALPVCAGPRAALRPALPTFPRPHRPHRLPCFRLQLSTQACLRLKPRLHINSSLSSIRQQTPSPLHAPMQSASLKEQSTASPRVDLLSLLAAGQVTRQTRSGELPQISAAITAEKAEDGSRISSPGLTDSRLYTHAGTGGSLSQLITDFGRTRNLVATSKLQQKAQDQSALATEQDVLLATDQAFYRLMNAQSLLDVAKATAVARGDVQNPHSPR